jgi:F0F1-type ATP synthase assembly protein I
MDSRSPSAEVRAAEGAGSRLRPRRLIVVALVVGLVAAGAFIVTASKSLYEVEEKGRDLLPYQTGEVYRVKVLDRVTLYADGESQPAPSTIQGTLLAVLATAAFMTFFFLRRARARPQVLQFYLVAGAGLAFVAFDELFALHETVGHNIRPLADLPGVERPDDVLVLLYAIPLAYCAYHFRGVIAESRRAMGLFAIGIGLFFVAALADLASAPGEEGFELLSVASVLMGLLTLFRQHVAETELPYRRDDEIRAARIRDEQPAQASPTR